MTAHIIQVAAMVIGATAAITICLGIYATLMLLGVIEQEGAVNDDFYSDNNTDSDNGNNQNHPGYKA